MQMISGIPENDLVSRMKSGDQTAFVLLFRFYYPGLVVFATHITMDREEAEEIVQDFFVRLWNKRKNIYDFCSLKSYLFVSIKNSSLNFLKREKVKEKLIGELKQLMKDNLLFEPELFIDSVLQKEIRNAFDKLPQRTREVFTMSRFQGIKNDEIAQNLGISKRTVETQISNALKILREELKDYLMLLLLL